MLLVPNHLNITMWYSTIILLTVMHMHVANATRTYDFVLPESISWSNPFCKHLGWTGMWNLSTRVNIERIDSIGPAATAVWVYEAALDQQALMLLRQSILTITNSDYLLLACGSSECMNTDLGDLSARVQRQWLVLPQLCEDIPLAFIAAQHSYLKLMMGPNWISTVQAVAQLCATWKYGGNQVNLRLSTAPKKQEDYWIPLNANLLLGSYLPPYSLHAALAIIAFVQHLPCWKMNSTWPLEFDTASIFTSIPSHSLSTQDLTPLSNPPLVGRYGTLKTWSGNSGDETQSYPGIQFLPHVDELIDRRLLASVNNQTRMRIFLNAWYGDADISFPPALSLDPFLFGMHFSGVFVEKLNDPNVIDYFTSYGSPIGARDTTTLHRLQIRNIPVYFSGCPTLLMQRLLPPGASPMDAIVVSDVYNDILHSIVPVDLRKKVIRFSQYVNRSIGFHGKFDDSFRYLTLISRAKVVITSRIHTALPAVGMGIPVIFVNTKVLPGGGGNRTDGLLQFFTVFTPTENWNGILSKELRDGILSKLLQTRNPIPHVVDRLRCNFVFEITKVPALAAAGRLYGVIPLRRHGANKEQSDTLVFHVTYTTEEYLTQVAIRSVESILYHHPNAILRIHTNAKTASATFQYLSDGGFSVDVIPYNIAELLHHPDLHQLDPLLVQRIGEISQTPAWITLENTIVSLLYLFKDGGHYISNHILLRDSVSRLYSTVSCSPDVVFAQFKPNHEYVRMCIEESVKSLASWNGDLSALFSRVLLAYCAAKGSNCPIRDVSSSAFDFAIPVSDLSDVGVLNSFCISCSRIKW